MRRARLPVATLIAALLVLGACGGDDQEGAGGPAGQGTPVSSNAASTWPLTGLPVADGKDAAREHPVLVAKIDNSGAEQQVGLGKADLVVEELVEGGTTRLAAFYYSELPTTAGPMRSMRSSDIGIVKPVNGDIVTSGAAPVTIKRITGSGIDFFGESAKGFSRDGTKHPPYDLMANLEKVAKGVKQDAERPKDYLAWGKADATLGGQPAKTFSASFSGSHTSEWKYADGRYQLLNGNAPDDDFFAPDTVLVLRVKTSDAGYRDPAGNPVPETHFTGKGDALVFHGGKVLRGTWTKDGLDQTVTLSTKAGEVRIPAGHVWIELVPKNGGDVTFK